MLSLADFFGILTHNLIKSHIRDGSRHLDCCRASFYNDALQFMGARRSFKEREVDSEPLALREISGICFKDQGKSLIKHETDPLVLLCCKDCGAHGRTHNKQFSH